MAENKFETVQQGRHAVRALVSEGYKAAREQREENRVEFLIVSGLTKEAVALLQGVTGLSQQEQVDRLNEVGALVARASQETQVEAAKAAFEAARALLDEASEANDEVTNLAATRDFEAHQQAKRERREAERAAYSEDDEEYGYDEDDYYDEDDDEE